MSISLCMIVKNEENNIAICLNSVKEIVDEIIIVDTGSTDKTKELAEEICKNFNIQAKIFDFKWDDDFSSARNESLRHATKDWILVLDADEAFSPEDAKKLKDLIREKSLITENVYGYYFIIRTYTDDSSAAGWKPIDNFTGSLPASGWFETKLIRMFRNELRIKFRNIIHETVDPYIHQIGKVLDASFPIHHFGRISKDKKEKDDLYFNLTKKKGDDFHSLYHIGVQLQEMGKFKEAINYFEESVKKNPNYFKSWLNLGGCYIKANELEKAENCLIKGAELNPNNESIYSNLGIAYAKQNRNSEAINSFFKSLLLNPKNANVLFNLGILYDKIGAKEKALFCFQSAIKINPKYQEKVKIK